GEIGRQLAALVLQMLLLLAEPKIHGAGPPRCDTSGSPGGLRRAGLHRWRLGKPRASGRVPQNYARTDVIAHRRRYLRGSGRRALGARPLPVMLIVDAETEGFR